MNILHPQAALLLSYADKQLAAEDMLEAEALIAEDPEAALFVKALGVSALPYAESFECLLEENTTETTLDHQSVRKHNTYSAHKKSTWYWPASMAASLLLGIAVGFGVFSQKSSPSQNMAESWITEVANYQLLYVRETVTPAPSMSKDQTIALQAKLGKALDSELTIPDLSKQKLDFRRGQLLDIEGSPLVQLAYLPEDGLPVALCVLRSGAEDSLPISGESRGLSYIEWSKNGLSYVLIGKTDMKVLESAAFSAMNQSAG